MTWGLHLMWLAVWQAQCTATARALVLTAQVQTANWGAAALLYSLR